ncbi:substrate-binding domain-containing protein [Mucilaginibacter sp. Bleaf8]|uniref:LacI family DNA-binding transcriptional regulator n=1 Tax=Mucilaginibacter sp. Bleaf8 TaxID=2834430 RepID=UPI001BCB879D|nr:substrate-binding domain-containing protein [Mucilaginibacter sp. Bleaf8]
MSKKLSIADIASRLNISKTTVSFILNGRAQEKRISEKLVKQVTDYIAEVGYKPNALAQSLATGKSNIIGLMVEDISNPFFATIARLIEDRAYENGYKIVYCSTDNDTERAREQLKIFQDRHVDGYIIAPPPDIEADIEQLIKQGFPVVLFDRYLPKVNTDYVVVDNYYSTYNATRKLIESGHKKIAFITFLSEQTQMQERRLGYETAIKEFKLKPNLKEIKFHRNEELINEPLFSYLKKNRALDAVLFGTDHIGTCGLKMIKKLGLKIPDDLAVISFDDYSLFELYSVTAIGQPIVEIADHIITLLLKKLNKTQSSSTQKMTLSTYLAERESAPFTNVGIAKKQSKAAIHQKDNGSITTVSTGKDNKGSEL